MYLEFFAAALAAIIMTAVFGLVDIKEARHLWQISRSDLAMMGITFVATLTLGIEQGILLGVAASLVTFIWQTSRPHVAVLGRLPGGREAETGSCEEASEGPAAGLHRVGSSPETAVAPRPGDGAAQPIRLRRFS